MKNIIKGAIVEELNASIKGTELEKLGPTEIKNFLREINTIGESYTGRDLTSIDKSKEAFNEDAMLELLASNMFYNNVKYDSKILALIFKYLLFSTNDRIINKTIEQYFKRYKHFFKDVNFKPKSRLNESTDVLEKLKELDAIEQGKKLEKKNPVIGNRKINNIMVFGEYEATSQLIKKIRKTIEYDFLANDCKKLECFEKLIKLYVDEDITNKNFAYIYKLFTKKIAREKDEYTRQEMMLILQSIDIIRISFEKGSDKYKTVDIDFSAYNRILNKCDQFDVELGIEEILAIEKTLTINNKEHQKIRNEILNVLRVYKSTNYAITTEEIINEINKKYNIDLRQLYHGIGEECITTEMLDNLSDTRFLTTKNKYPYYTSRLGIHKSTEKALKDEKQKLDEYLEKETISVNRKKEIAKKYKTLRAKINNDVMLSYLMLKYVPIGDQKDVLDLIKYWQKNNMIKEVTKDDPRKKKNTIESLINDFKNECSNITYKKYEAIEDKYLSIYDALNIYTNKGKRTSFIKLLNQVKKDVVVRDVKKSLKDIKDKLIAHKNPYNILVKKGITIDVLESILPLVEEEKIKDIIATIVELTSKEIEDKKQQEKQDRLDDAIALINAFITSTCKTKEEFLEQIGIDKKMFDKALSITKDIEELNARYKEKINNERRKEEISLLPEVQELTNDILNGVTLPNGDIVPFEHIDFVTRTNLSVDEFLNIVKNQLHLPADEELTVIKTVKSKVKTLPMLNEYFLTEKYIINDIEIPLEVKKAILEYLKEHGVEKDIRAYRQSINRYLIKGLDISEYLGEFDDSYIFENQTKKN